MSTALWLWLLAITLTWPVPAVLARARRLLSVPRAAVVLWQAVAVAALLAVFGASLATMGALALGLLIPSAAGQGQPRPPADLGATGVLHLGIAAVLLVLTVVAVVKLNAVGIQVARRLRRHRRRHRDLVDLLARTGLTDALDPRDVRVLSAGENAYAYCLPGRHSRVVISDAAARDLTGEQLAAVIEHERAHLRARHDLLLEFFTVLYEAAGRRAGTRAALEQTAVLVELLADDAARRRHGPQPLIGALATMGASQAPVRLGASQAPVHRGGQAVSREGARGKGGPGETTWGSRRPGKAAQGKAASRESTLDADMPGAGGPDRGIAGGGMPGVGMSGTGRSGAGMPGTGMPGTGRSGAGMPGVGTSGAGMPGTGISSAGMSGTGMPGTGTSGTGMSGAGMPGTAEVIDHDVLPRLRRLIDAPVSTPPRGLATAVYLLALAVVAVPTLALALPWLTTTWATVR